MKKLMQKSTSRKQLLQNTIDYFNSENRSTTYFNSCKYRLNGKACAIGREISDELAKEFDDLENTGVYEDDIFDALPKRLQRLGKEYLSSIQKLHDSSLNWDNGGLSAKGKQSVESMIKKYDLKGIKL